jgi:bifunctional non-homologous end joining protein LigD
VRTRRGLNWTDRFPSIAGSAAKLSCRNAVMYGEAVMLDAEGKPDFAALQLDLTAGGKNTVGYVFDCCSTTVVICALNRFGSGAKA